jgi:hypothetical protein
MATTLRGRRAAYDNIAAGAAAGAERTISGDTVSKVEIYGGGYRTSTSTGDEWFSNVKQGASVTDCVANGTVAGGAIAENLVAAATTNTEERTGSSNTAGFVTNA